MDEEDAKLKPAELLEETEDRGWRITIPKIRNWRSKIEDLKLDALYSGVSLADDL